nr:protein of unknown function (DUF1697) [uncultured bacterium]
MDIRYVALLRGVNVGGNNKASMVALRSCFEDLGFADVSTYIISGNVLFASSETSAQRLTEACEAAIEGRFGFKVVCCVLSAEELRAAIDHAPSWWGVGNEKHDALFVIAPMSSEEVMSSVGEAKPEYERVASFGRVIFWTAPAATFSRTRYSKIVGSSVYRYITIRNANTTRKLLELST